MKAIIPAAGQGTRFLPASKAVPKELLPVLDKPVLQYVVEEALAAGASEVIVVCNDDKPEISAHFTPAPALERSLELKGKAALAAAVRHAGELPVSYVGQPKPLGLGHAVHCAAEAVGAVETPGAGAGAGAGAPQPQNGPQPQPSPAPEPFYVLLGDVLVPDNQLLLRMKASSAKHNNASVIAVIAVPEEEVSRFGVIDASLAPGGEDAGNAVWRVHNLVEKPAREEAPSNLAIFGRYLLTPQVMRLLATTKPGAGGEIQLTDALIELLKTEELYAIEVGEDEGFDCGTVASWLDTNIRLAARNPELWQEVQAAYDKIST